MSYLDIENLISENIKGLPIETLKEILDFTIFLKEKKSNEYYLSSLKTELSSLNDSELIHLDSEFKDYKDLYPYDK